MKALWKWILALAAALLIAVPSAAADTANRAAGYFDNTRAVLLLPAAGRSGYAASFMDRQLGRIFRYPYYRLVETADAPAGPDAMRAAAVSAGADIAVWPVAVRFDQYSQYPMFGDRDPVIVTHAELRIYYWEDGMANVKSIGTRYFDAELEGPDTRPEYILDEMWKRLLKQFPYRRIPTDRSTNLSGTVTAPAAEADAAEEKAPKAETPEAPAPAPETAPAAEKASA